MAARSNGSANPQSVLVIEDDSLICKLLQVVLEHHGHAVEIAETYAAGEAAIAKGQPRMIILDLGLPDGDGDRSRHAETDRVEHARDRDSAFRSGRR